jgi:hypothetical protein
MDYGQTDTSTTSLGTNQFPANSVFVPGDTKLTVVQGGPKGTDVNGRTYTPVAEYVPDGNDVTQGTSTDANTVNSVMGRLTKIRDLLNATLTVGGTITEANSAAIKADLDAINTAIGLISDAAWSGSGNGSEIAILKKIVAELAATLTVSGTITANAGTNLNTSALALEAGHLATIDSHIPAQGQALAAASMPVVLPAAQITTLTPPAAITGFALEAGHLANIDTHTPALGQATKANSVPMTLASDQGDLPVKGDFTEVAGQGTGVVNGVGTFLLPETDVSAYKHFSFTLSGTWSLTLIVEVSDTSGANYSTLVVQQPNPSVANFSSITANGTYDGPLKWRFLRVRVSAFTSNTSLASTFEFYTQSGALEAINAVQVGTWTVQPGNTANTTPWLATINQGGNSAAVSASNALKVDNSAVTQPDNVTQFGGTNISTGTGTGGAGIPRVTVSNDSNVLATQSGTWTVQPGNTANTTPWLVTRVDGQKTTYSASYTGLAGVAGDLFVLGGSATKTVRLTRLEISGVATTAAYFDIKLDKRSTADTGGTKATAATIAPHDSNNAAATGTVDAYTAAPTQGTSVGVIRSAKLTLPITTTVSNTEKVVWDFGIRPAQAPVLRGTTQQLALILSGAPSGGSIDINCEWTEE